MTDTIGRDMAARRLLADETIQAAFGAVEKSLTASLLNAATPEDREAVFQEIRALRGVKNRLASWSGADALRRKNERQA